MATLTSGQLSRKKEGLSNSANSTCPLALDVYKTKVREKLFEATQCIENHYRTHARHEIMFENFIKKFKSKSRCDGRPCMNHISRSCHISVYSVHKKMIEMPTD